MRNSGRAIQAAIAVRFNKKLFSHSCDEFEPRAGERGQLSLDDTIGKLLPNYPNTNVASEVKVRHLLSHTGGPVGDRVVQPGQSFGFAHRGLAHARMQIK
jgi:hypothetical protein